MYFELVIKEFLKLLELRFAHMRARLYFLHRFNCAIRNHNQRLACVSDCHFLVLVVSQGRLCYHDPFWNEAKVESSLELIQLTLEKNFLFQHLRPINVKLLVMAALKILKLLHHRSSICPNLWL